jgi:RNA polymerase sigma factor (sigma-70 family)
MCPRTLADDLDEGVTRLLRTRRGSFGRGRDLATPDAVSRFQNGDPETVRAVKRLVLDVLRTHSNELSPYWDDLVLEVCAQAWQRVRSGGDRIQNLEGLVAHIAHARVVDLHRLRSRWRLESGSDEHLASIADRDLGPYENLLRDEASRLVSAMIAAVDERTRAIWKLLYFEGLKYREAALRLGLPEGTLKRLVHESLRAAARQFAGVRTASPGQGDPHASKTSKT